MRVVRYYPTKSGERLRFIIFDADTEPCEVLMAFWMFLLAFAFWAYGPEMLKNPAFTVLGAVAPVQVWTVGTFIVATSKLLSAMYDSTRWRLASVAAGALIWSLVTISVWFGPNLGIGTVLYPAFACVSLWLAWRIGWRAGRREQRE